MAIPIFDSFIDPLLFTKGKIRFITSAIIVVTSLHMKRISSSNLLIIVGNIGLVIVILRMKILFG